jgi:hypothetical protein
MKRVTAILVVFIILIATLTYQLWLPTLLNILENAGSIKELEGLDVILGLSATIIAFVGWMLQKFSKNQAQPETQSVYKISGRVSKDLIEKEFVGRENLKKKFQELLSTGGVLWIYGPTGSGKSWALEYFRYYCEDHNIDNCLVDLYGSNLASLDEILDEFANCAGEPKYSQYRSHSKKFKIFSKDKQVNAREVSEVKNLMIKGFLTDILPRDKPFVMLLDTLEKGTESLQTDVELLVELLVNSVSQRRPNRKIILVIAGWQKPKDISKHFSIYPIGGLDKNESKQFVEKRLDLKIDENTIERIIKLTTARFPNPNKNQSNPFQLTRFVDLIKLEIDKCQPISIDQKQTALIKIVKTLEKTEFNEIASRWVKIFMERVPPEIHPYIVASVIPRRVNQYVLSALHSEPLSNQIKYFILGIRKRVFGLKFEKPSDKMISYLEKQLGGSFYRKVSKDIFEYHEEMRRSFIVFLSTKKNELYRNLNKRAAIYFEAKARELTWKEEKGARYAIESFYHWLRCDEHKAKAVLDKFLNINNYDLELLDLIYTIVEPNVEGGWVDKPPRPINEKKILLPILRRLTIAASKRDYHEITMRGCERIQEILSEETPSELTIDNLILLAKAARWLKGDKSIRTLDEAKRQVQVGLDSTVKNQKLLEILSLEMNIQRLFGNYARALEAQIRAYNISSPSSLDKDQKIKHNLGRMNVLVGNVAAGLKHYEDIHVNIKQKAHTNPKGYAYFLTHVAEAFFFARLYEQGVQWSKKSQNVLETNSGEKKWPARYGITLWNLARNLEKQIPHEEFNKDSTNDITKYYEEAAALQAERNYKFGEAWMLLDLAKLFAKLGRFQESREKTYEALISFCHTRSWHKIAEGLLNLADIDSKQGQDPPEKLFATITKISLGKRTITVRNEIKDLIYKNTDKKVSIGIIPQDRKYCYFHILSRLHITKALITLNIKRDLLKASKHFSAACQYGICHSIYELNNCLEEIKPWCTEKQIKKTLYTDWKKQVPEQRLKNMKSIHPKISERSVNFKELEMQMLKAEYINTRGDILVEFKPKLSKMNEFLG